MIVTDGHVLAAIEAVGGSTQIQSWQRMQRALEAAARYDREMVKRCQVQDADVGPTALREVDRAAE